MAQKFAPAVQQNAFCQRAVCFHVCPSVCRRDGLVAHLQINNPHSALYGFAVLVSSAQAAGGARCKKRPPPLIRDLVALANYRRAHFHYFICGRRVYLPQPAAGIFLYFCVRGGWWMAAHLSIPAQHIMHQAGHRESEKKTTNRLAFHQHDRRFVSWCAALRKEMCSARQPASIFWQKVIRDQVLLPTVPNSNQLGYIEEELRERFFLFKTLLLLWKSAIRLQIYKNEAEFLLSDFNRPLNLQKELSLKFSWTGKTFFARDYPCPLIKGILKASSKFRN